MKAKNSFQSLPQIPLSFEELVKEIDKAKHEKFYGVAEFEKLWEKKEEKILRELNLKFQRKQQQTSRTYSDSLQLIKKSH